MVDIKQFFGYTAIDRGAAYVVYCRTSDTQDSTLTAERLIIPKANMGRDTFAILKSIDQTTLEKVMDARNVAAPELSKSIYKMLLSYNKLQVTAIQGFDKRGDIFLAYLNEKNAIVWLPIERQSKLEKLEILNRPSGGSWYLVQDPIPPLYQ